jgi:hypothetical protein
MTQSDLVKSLEPIVGSQTALTHSVRLPENLCAVMFESEAAVTNSRSTA